LEPFLDVVAVIAVKMTAEIVPSKSSQITHAVDDEFSVIELKNFSKSMEKRRRGVKVAAWEQARNEQGVTVDWQFTKDGRTKLHRLYPTLEEAEN